MIIIFLKKSFCEFFFSSDNPRVTVLQLDGAVDVAELASSGQTPRLGQVDEVTGVATVEGGGFLEVPVQDFRFEHFVFVLKGLLPDKGKLPVFVAIGGLQGDVASAVAFGFPFQEAGAVVGVGMEGEVAQVGVDGHCEEVGRVAVRVVLAEVEAAEQSPVGRDGELFRHQPVACIGHGVQGVNLFLVALGVDEPVVGCAFVHRHVGVRTFLVESLQIDLQTGVVVRQPEGVIRLPVGLEVGTAYGPFHAVGADGGIADHGHP